MIVDYMECEMGLLVFIVKRRLLICIMFTGVGLRMYCLLVVMLMIENCLFVCELIVDLYMFG